MASSATGSEPGEQRQENDENSMMTKNESHNPCDSVQSTASRNESVTWNGLNGKMFTVVGDQESGTENRGGGGGGGGRGRKTRFAINGEKLFSPVYVLLPLSTRSFHLNLFYHYFPSFSLESYSRSFIMPSCLPQFSQIMETLCKRGRREGGRDCTEKSIEFSVSGRVSNLRKRGERREEREMRATNEMKGSTESSSVSRLITDYTL